MYVQFIDVRTCEKKVERTPPSFQADLGEILEEHGIQRDKMSMQEMLRSGSSASQPNPGPKLPMLPPPDPPRYKAGY